MLRFTLLITTLLALLASPAGASASPQQIYDDCDNGRLDERHSDADLRKALKDVPEDLDEYTSCSDLIRGALSGVDTMGQNTGGGGGGTGAGGSGPTDLPQGNGAGSVPLDPKGKPLNPLIDAQQDERDAVAAAQQGQEIRPTSAGVRPGEPDGELPLPLLVVLGLAGIAALAAAALRGKQLLSGRPA